jgi:hypothetical protein
MSNDQLAFATSKSGLVRINEFKTENTALIPASASGEFRDVAFTDKKLIVMTSGENGELLTFDFCKTNTVLWRAGMFFDAMDDRNGRIVVLADPVSSYFPLFIVDPATAETVEITGPAAIGDEACYAASGTTIEWISDSTIVFVSGGSEAARFHRSDDLGKTWSSYNLPLQTGEGCGPFSLCFISGNHVIAVGGSYTDPSNPAGTAAWSSDGGKTWNVPEKGPNGYRSCVAGTKKFQFACGSNGIDISKDGGKTWQPFDSGNYCALLLEKKHLYATTSSGSCIRYRLK